MKAKVYDPIVEEVRRVRERHTKTYGYDLDAVCKALREDQQKSGCKIVSLPPKEPQAWAKVR